MPEIFCELWACRHNSAQHPTHGACQVAADDSVDLLRVSADLLDREMREIHPEHEDNLIACSQYERDRDKIERAYQDHVVEFPTKEGE